MTLAEIQADVYRRCGFATSPATEVSTRVTAFINETQNEILSEPGMEALMNGSITFASVASTPQYSLPQAAARVKHIYETTNDRTLTRQSQDWYRNAYPDVTAVTGTPDAFVDLGYTNIAVQPSNASEIFVDSTSASDTNTAYLEGYRTGGYFRSLSVSMTGVTAVSLGTAITDFVFLTKFYISAAAVGTVTLHEDASGGTELARIGIGQTFPRYRRVALVPTPAAVVTYTCDFEYDVTDMANAADQPILPPRFHRLLAIGARAKEYEKQDDKARYVLAKQELATGIRKLKFFLYSQSAGNPNLQGPRRARASQLGGFYPAGS